MGVSITFRSVSEPDQECPPLWFGPLIRKTVAQIAAIVALGFGLGFSFNAMNPIGIRSSVGAGGAAAGAAARLQEPRSASFTNTEAHTNPRRAPAPPDGPVNPPLPVPVLAASPSPNANAQPTITLIPVQPTGTPGTVTAPAAAPAGTPMASSTPAGAVSSPIVWAETKALIGSSSVLLVDARPKAAFDLGHMPGAVSLYVGSTPEEFAAFRQQHALDKPIITYCSSLSCSLSRSLADRLIREYGYTSVRYLHGGYNDWLREQHASQPAPK